MEKIVKIKSFRVHFTLSKDDEETYTVQQVVKKLQRGLNFHFPKFSIAKLVISPRSDICYIQARNRPSISNEFQRDFDGLLVDGSINQQRIRLDLLLGPESIMYKWSSDEAKLITTSDDSCYFSFADCSEIQKKIKTSDLSTKISTLEEIEKLLSNKIATLEDALRQLQEQHNQLLNKRFEELMMQAVQNQTKKVIKPKTRQTRKQEWLIDLQINGLIQKWAKHINQKNVRLYETTTFELLKNNHEEALNLEEYKESYALIPVNYHDQHWALLVWKRRDAELYYLDSLGWTVENNFHRKKTGNKRACEYLLKTSCKENGIKMKTKAIFDVNVPQQKNYFDCGPLMLATMQKLAENDGKLIDKLNSTNYSTVFKGLYKPEIEAEKIRNLLSSSI